MTSLTANQIEEYLNTEDDFDLELFVYRTLIERGVPAQHGGTYIKTFSWRGKPDSLTCGAIKDVSPAEEGSFHGLLH